MNSPGSLYRRKTTPCAGARTTLLPLDTCPLVVKPLDGHLLLDCVELSRRDLCVRRSPFHFLRPGTTPLDEFFQFAQPLLTNPVLRFRGFQASAGLHALFGDGEKGSVHLVVKPGQDLPWLDHVARQDDDLPHDSCFRRRDVDSTKGGDETINRLGGDRCLDHGGEQSEDVRRRGPRQREPTRRGANQAL